MKQSLPPSDNRIHVCPTASIGPPFRSGEGLGKRGSNRRGAHSGGAGPLPMLRGGGCGAGTSGDRHPGAHRTATCLGPSTSCQQDFPPR